MAVITLTDGLAQQVNGICIKKGTTTRGSFVAGVIPQIGAAPQGWVRVAYLGYIGGQSCTIILSGGWGTGRATTLVATLSNFYVEAARLKFNIQSCTQGSYTKIRVVKDPDSNGLWLDLYNASTSSPNLGIHSLAIIGTGDYEIYAPTSVLTETYTALGEWTLTNSKNYGTPTSGAATGVSSLAAIKTQLSAWYSSQGTSSVGYYTLALQGTISPFSTSANLVVEIRASSTANYATAILTAHNTNGGAMYMMSLNNGTWTDPKTVTLT